MHKFPNWFHVKSERKKISLFSTLCVKQLRFECRNDVAGWCSRFWMAFVQNPFGKLYLAPKLHFDGTSNPNREVLGILKNCLILMRMSIWSEILWQVKKWGRFFKSTLGGFSHDLKTCLKSSGSDLLKKVEEELGYQKKVGELRSLNFFALGVKIFRKEAKIR